jgi:CheY-like chemotaxis protein
MLSNSYAPIAIDLRNQSEAVLRGKRVLIVEDEPLVAVDYHFQLQGLGAVPVGYKSTNSAALDFLASNEVDAVIVDYALGDGKSEPVMRWLLRRAIPFAVMTGNKPEMGPWIGIVPVLDKPVTPMDLRHALVGLLLRHRVAEQRARSL